MADRILTDEIRDKLLGTIPFSAESSIDYTPSRYKESKKMQEVPKEFIPVFKVRPFNKAEKKEADELFKRIGSATQDEIRNRVQKNILGMINMFDAGTRKEIEYKPSEGSTWIDRNVLEHIPKIVVEDILYYLITISGLMDLDKLGLRF